MFGNKKMLQISTSYDVIYSIVAKKCGLKNVNSFDDYKNLKSDDRKKIDELLEKEISYGSDAYIIEAIETINANCSNEYRVRDLKSLVSLGDELSRNNKKIIAKVKELNTVYLNNGNNKSTNNKKKQRKGLFGFFSRLLKKAELPEVNLGNNTNTSTNTNSDKKKGVFGTLRGMLGNNKNNSISLPSSSDQKQTQTNQPNNNGLENIQSTFEKFKTIKKEMENNVDNLSEEEKKDLVQKGYMSLNDLRGNIREYQSKNPRSAEVNEILNEWENCKNFVEKFENNIKEENKVSESLPEGCFDDEKLSAQNGKLPSENLENEQEFQTNDNEKLMPVQEEVVPDGVEQSDEGIIQIPTDEEKKVNDYSLIKAIDIKKIELDQQLYSIDSAIRQMEILNRSGEGRVSSVKYNALNEKKQNIIKMRNLYSDLDTIFVEYEENIRELISCEDLMNAERYQQLYNVTKMRYDECVAKLNTALISDVNTMTLMEVEKIKNNLKTWNFDLKSLVNRTYEMISPRKIYDDENITKRSK